MLAWKRASTAGGDDLPPFHSVRAVPFLTGLEVQVA